MLTPAPPSPESLSYDPFQDAFLDEPFDIYRRLRDEAPVYRATTSGRDYYVLSRFADVFAAARDAATFSSAKGLTPEEDEILKLGLAPTIVMMDPPRQNRLRRLVSRGFTLRRVSDLEAPIRRFVTTKLDALSADGGGDFISALAGPLPTFTVAHFLGVPEEDHHRFDRWSDAIVQANAAGSVVEKALGAVLELYQYFQGLIQERRTEPEDDMVSILIQSEVDGERLEVEDILGFCFVMIAGGNDTTTGLLGGGLALLEAYPEQRARLAKDSELIPNAVEELLRLTSPVQGLSRSTTKDVTLHGVTIPAETKVHLLYAAANRDPREFGANAEDLDIDRSIEAHMAFTSGPHHCLGAAVARLQSRIAIEEVLARWPQYRLDLQRAKLAPGAFIRRYQTLPIAW
ncbi:MAG: cytochrome P450 [Myxococcales bacterium]|nr:cytochrome P450 [Myxococcales bacterium]